MGCWIASIYDALGGRAFFDGCLLNEDSETRFILFLHGISALSMDLRGEDEPERSMATSWFCD